ncbi:MAG: HORMA domain containing protein [Phycisphaerales bacterium]|nr:HORMA domain containing protein [Phycisphaerales bacterium]
MSTFTASITYTHTVTYVTTKMLLTLKEIIREIGLDPARFTDSWDSYERAISTWLSSRHLQRVTLEVYDPRNNGLVTRWDMDVLYSTVGDGSLWVDTAAIRYSIVKAGLVPAHCRYDIILTTAPGRPDVAGWGSCDFRSTDGFQRFSVGATVGGNGLSAQTAYWSR